MCPSQTGKSSYRAYSLDWQGRQVANCAVGSKVFKGFVTLWPNCSNEAVTRTYVSKNKTQEGITASQSAVEVSPVAEQAATRDSWYAQTCSHLCNRGRERRVYLRHKSNRLSSHGGWFCHSGVATRRLWNSPWHFKSLFWCAAPEMGAATWGSCKLTSVTPP